MYILFFTLLIQSHLNRLYKLESPITTWGLKKWDLEDDLGTFSRHLESIKGPTFKTNM